LVADPVELPEDPVGVGVACKVAMPLVVLARVVAREVVLLAALATGGFAAEAVAAAVGKAMLGVPFALKRSVEA